MEKQAEYVCRKRCFWQNALFEPGEVVKVPASVKVPEHFEAAGVPPAPAQGGKPEKGADKKKPAADKAK